MTTYLLEFWLGLEKLHRLTASTQHNELRIDMEDFDKNTEYTKYSSFKIGNADSNYKLTVGGYNRTSTAGDSLMCQVVDGNKQCHDDQPFSTKDRDNGNYAFGNCAKKSTGAWWYYSCHMSNLNGQYFNGRMENEQYGKGVNWYSCCGYFYSLKFTEMKVRPSP